MCRNRINKKIEYILQSSTIKNILFDLDGTLVETDFANYLSYKKSIQKIISPNVDIPNLNGRFNRKVLKKHYPNLTKIQYEKIIQLKNKFYIKFLHKTKLNDSVVEILINLYNKKTILVTRSSKERMIITLKYHGIIDKFSHLFSQPKSFNKNKINKYKDALSHFQISPQSVIIFENEESEIKKAIGAGIPFKNIIHVKNNF